MNKGIIIITGPTEAGKTWLANCIQEKYGEMDCVIWDEPHLAKKTIAEIKRFAKIGIAIIVKTDVTRIEFSIRAPYKIIRVEE